MAAQTVSQLYHRGLLGVVAETREEREAPIDEADDPAWRADTALDDDDDDEDDERRFELHDLMRDFAFERLRNSSADEPILKYHKQAFKS